MLDLWDYRRRVSDMYHQVRTGGTANIRVCAEFRRRKDELFRTHVQSPLTRAQRSTFTGLCYYKYNPDYAVWAVVHSLPRTVDTEQPTITLDLGADGTCILRHFADVTFSLPTGAGTLSLFWIAGYGGGVFLPFRDATNGLNTYGGGRYLLDTIKGADLGASGNQIRLDFNYAYHPSCAYNPRWICPLAPLQNQLPFPIPTGEQLTPYLSELTEP